jgi:L-2,4-diaminobutyrate decarboxylase
MHAAVCGHPQFEAVHRPESNILCFRFVGDRSRSDEDLDALNLALRTAYNRGGDGWITTTVLAGRRVLRATIMNPRTTSRDVERVLEGLAAAAADLRRGETP